MIVGIIVGTYSSIFIASPYVVLWEKYFGGFEKVKSSGETTKVDESNRRYISKKKRAKKAGTEGEASA